jgi:hypothetical protein
MLKTTADAFRVPVANSLADNDDAFPPPAAGSRHPNRRRSRACFVRGGL